MSHHRLAVLACLVLVAGCGGGSETESGGTPSFEAPAVERDTALIRGYGPDARSAGVDESYVPSGEILADSEFRPWQDGFSFENYGNDAGPQNMTAAQVEEIFGSQVCLSGTGDSCALLPAAKRWMDNQNAAMAGGHCMGFSVTALRMFDETLRPDDFGAPTTAELEIQGNIDLQETIAQTWVYQGLPLVREEIVQAAPSRLLEVLEQSLETGEESYTVGIFNETGGHAITPFAIEDRGDGEAYVLVYDNNFPGIIRTIAFDTEADTWRYVGGPNPDDLGQVYEGGAKPSQQAMVLLPTSPGLQQQPCPFCEKGATAGPGGEDVGSVLGSGEQYDEITLVGDPANHPHLSIVDTKGNRLGYFEGELVNEIPGAEIVRNFAIQNWKTAPEPTYRLPTGTAVNVSIDGSDLERRTKADLTLVSPGEYFEVNEIKMRPGQVDDVQFKGGLGGLNYETNATIGSAPLIGGGLTRGEGEDLEAYYFIASPVGIEGAASMALVIDEDEGLVGIDTAGTQGDLAGTGAATYAFVLTKATADGTTSTWSSKDEGLSLRSGKGGEVAAIQFDEDYARDSRIPVLTRTASGKEGVQYLVPNNDAG